MAREIFKLSQNLVDPRFNGFRFKRGTKSVTKRKNRELDFDPDDGRRFDWKPQRLKKTWETPTLVGPVPRFHDYPCVGSIPCFSRRAVNALEDLLKPNGELLPTSTDLGTFYLYNILTVSDSLIADKSEMIMLGKTGVAIGISFFAFDKAAIEDLTIFRLRYRPPEVFVTEVFKQRVEDANLNGFLFEKVWPFKQGVNWQEKAGEVRRRIREQTKELRGESVYIDAYYSTDGLSAIEKKKLAKMADSLELLLSDEAKLHQKYLGTLETTADCHQFARFYVSCPSMKKIQKTLTAWVTSRKWPHRCVMTLRSGHLYANKVKEQKIELS